jgi:hypothetical protein
MSDSCCTFLIILFLTRFFRAERFIIEYFEPFIDEISFPVLPFRIVFFDSFHKYSGAILVIKVIFLKGKHFRLVFMTGIKPFQIFLAIAHVLNILVSYICRSSLLFTNLGYNVAIVI